MATTLYLPHADGEGLPSTLNKDELLLEALETIVKEYPPQEKYGQPLRGLWNGPTAIAYLFLHVSAARPELQVASESALHWAEAYLAGTRDAESLVFVPEVRCGISSELLGYQAVRAAVSKDVSHVKDFLQNILTLVEGESEVEWHSGRAGALYMIRMIQHWVPESAPLLWEANALLRKSVVAEGPDWKFRGTRYIGAVHGDIGTLTQVALASPTDTEKQKLQDWLVRLLDWQKDDGNWSVNEQVDPRPYVQICHGAPGFIQSLRSIRPLFPALEDRIDQALAKGNALIWEEGLSKKEPNLCHGAFGNCLTLPPVQRDAMLARVTPKSVADVRNADPTLFEKANYGSEYSLLTGYWPGAAWTWLVSEKSDAGIIGYNDV